MPRLTPEGNVTIPKDIRSELGIDPGDEIAFEKIESGYRIRKQAQTTASGDSIFKKYRDSAENDDTLPERMRRLRGEYPRTVDGGT